VTARPGTTAPDLERWADLDHGDPDLCTGPERHAMWAALAAADAVPRSRPGSSPSGFWSVFSHAAVRAVLAPAGPFTSEDGMMIGFDRTHRDRAGGRMLVVTDGEHHTRLRRLIAPFLSRAMAGALSGFIADEVRLLLAEPLAGTAVDAAATIGPRLPAAVTSEILGVPGSDREHLVELTHHAFGGEDSAFGAMSPSEAHSQILMYFHELIEHRRRKPGDDLVSTLLADGALTTRDVLLNCDNVLIGGNETTRHALTGCFHALAGAPDALRALRSDPAALRPAVEEVVRWTSPAMHVLRVATEDVVVAGRRIGAGEAVVAWLPAANSDPRVFDDGRALRIGREPNRHLAFGTGAHHCLGAALARAELACLLRALADSADAVGTGEPRWLRSNLVQGYRQLEVTLVPLPPRATRR
jgi:hydroxylation protein CepL